MREKKGKEDPHQALFEHIRRIHNKSRRTYGSPRVHADLHAEGVVCNHKRVVRLIHLKSLQGRRKRRKVATPDSHHTNPVVLNLLNREFSAHAPNVKWVVDIT